MRAVSSNIGNSVIGNVRAIGQINDREIGEFVKSELCVCNVPAVAYV